MGRVSLVAGARFWLGGFLVCLAVSTGLARAEDPVFLASTLWSSARAVRVCNEVAIVLFTRGLATFDVSNPAEPVLIQRFDRSEEFWSCQALEVAGDLAYAASASEGLKIFDFSDPTHPVLVGACDTPGDAFNLAISGNLAFIADGYFGGLQIVEISDPTAPEVLGGCMTPGGCFAVAVAAGGQYAYCADGLDGIAIVETTDPRHPLLRGSLYNITYPPFDVRVEGNYLYSIGCQGEKSAGGKSAGAMPCDRTPTGARTPWDPSGMDIHDISNPLVPILRGCYNSDQGTNCLSVRKNLAYIANASGTLSVVDVSDPSSPILVAQTATGGYSTDIHLVDDRAYVCASGGSLMVLDLGVPTFPVLLGRWWEANGSYDVSARGGLVCLADRTFGLHLVNASEPHDPRVVSHFALADGPWAVITDGEYAYVADDSAGVLVVDVTNPEVPAIAGHVGVYSDDLDFDGRYLYSVALNRQLHVIDAIDPRHPALTASLSLPGPSCSISVRGGFGCFTTGEALCVVELLNPAHPVMRGVFDPSEYVHQVSFDGTYAYASLGNNGLYVIDVSDPDAPTYVTELRFNTNTRGSCLDGDRLYFGAEGLSVIDVADPENPMLVGSAWTTGTMHVCIDGDLAFTADGSSIGIFRVGATADVQEPPAVRPTAELELVQPNPVCGTGEVLLRVARADRVRLELIDLLGRRAALLHDGLITAGELRVSWDATVLPTGRYYLRALTPSGTTTRPVVVLR
jgi:hypothetical protein